MLEKKYQGSKVIFKKVKNIKLKNVPEIFQSATYIGYCNSSDLPHGEGKLFPFREDEDFDPENDLELSLILFCAEGEWCEGNFLKGTYYIPTERKMRGNFDFNDEDWVLEGEGIRLHYGEYGSNEENYKNDNPVAQEKGIFKNNMLIKGEILNPPGVPYSGNIDADKIILDRIETKEKFYKELNDSIQLISGEIFYKDGSHYKGEMSYSFYVPFGKGTMKLPDGREWTTEWYDGEEKK
jgi:hypothetical protein